jgi:alpha-beta hydrolase superfamily lysophospholipase
MKILLKKIFTVASLLTLVNSCAIPCRGEAETKNQADIFINQSQVGSELKLPLHQWSNPDRPAKAIIVALQALIFDGTQWDSYARHLVEKGYIVYAPDFRGYGAWLSDTAEFGDDKAFHFGQSEQDLTKILTALRAKYPQKKIYCIGESLGANVAIWEASTNPKLFDGAVVIGLSNKHYPLRPKPHWVVTVAKGLSDHKKPFSLKPYMNVLTEDKTVTKEMINDPKTTTAISPTDLIKANITNKLALEHVEDIPPSMPILVIAGAGDRVQQTKSLDEVITRMGSEEKEFVVLPKKGHLLLEHRTVDPALAQVIDDWLERKQNQSAPAKASKTAETTNSALH